MTIQLRTVLCPSSNNFLQSCQVVTILVLCIGYSALLCALDPSQFGGMSCWHSSPDCLRCFCHSYFASFIPFLILLLISLYFCAPSSEDLSFFNFLLSHFQYLWCNPRLFLWTKVKSIGLHHKYWNITTTNQKHLISKIRQK